MKEKVIFWLIITFFIILIFLPVLPVSGFLNWLFPSSGQLNDEDYFYENVSPDWCSGPYCD